MPDASASSPAHRRLREETAQAHAAAEATPVMQRLLTGLLDEASYRAMLAGHRALYARFENECAAWLAALPAHGWRYQSRRALLDLDLGQADAPKLSPSARPTDAQAWGMLYVIEGSSLGGQVIVRRLREQWPTRAHHFFSHAPALDRPWRTFQAVLDRALSDPRSQRDAIEGAQTMFARFITMLEELDR
jgi:heme oxygenase